MLLTCSARVVDPAGRAQAVCGTTARCTTAGAAFAAASAMKCGPSAAAGADAAAASAHTPGLTLGLGLGGKLEGRHAGSCRRSSCAAERPAQHRPLLVTRQARRLKDSSQQHAGAAQEGST